MNSEYPKMQYKISLTITFIVKGKYDDSPREASFRSLPNQWPQNLTSEGHKAPSHQTKK